METSYQVKTEKFEGPLDLLLQLIENQKLEITEISLVGVTDQYLEYLKNLRNANHLEIAEFLSVASRLILLKSRALLPFFKLTEDEEEDIQDLQKRLEEYKKFKEFGRQIQLLFKKRNFEFSRDPYLGQTAVFYPPKNISAEILGEFFKTIIKRLPKKEILEEEKITKTISLEEVIADLVQKIEERVERAFSEIIASRQSKVEVIVSFLAILELTKRQLIKTRQETVFGEIIFAKYEYGQPEINN